VRFACLPWRPGRRFVRACARILPRPRRSPGSRTPHVAPATSALPRRRGKLGAASSAPLPRPPRPVAGPPRPGRLDRRCVAVGSPTPPVRVVRLRGMGDGGDRAPSDKDHRGPSMAGAPDRTPPRPDRTPPQLVVSPTYAQGSYYGTNRVDSGARGRLAGPAAALLSTTRAALPSGRDRSRWRSSAARTWRVSRNCPKRRGGCHAWDRGAHRPRAPGRPDGRFHLDNHPETGTRAGGAVAGAVPVPRRRHARATPTPAPRPAPAPRPRSASPARPAPDAATPRRTPDPANPARRYNPGRCRTLSLS